MSFRLNNDSIVINRRLKSIYKQDSDGELITVLQRQLN